MVLARSDAIRDVLSRFKILVHPAFDTSPEFECCVEQSLLISFAQTRSRPCEIRAGMDDVAHRALLRGVIGSGLTKKLQGQRASPSSPPKECLARCPLQAEVRRTGP